MKKYLVNVCVFIIIVSFMVTFLPASGYARTVAKKAFKPAKVGPLSLILPATSERYLEYSRQCMEKNDFKNARLAAAYVLNDTSKKHAEALDILQGVDEREAAYKAQPRVTAKAKRESRLAKKAAKKKEIAAKRLEKKAAAKAKKAALKAKREAKKAELKAERAAKKAALKAKREAKEAARKAAKKTKTKATTKPKTKKAIKKSTKVIKSTEKEIK